MLGLKSGAKIRVTVRPGFCAPQEIFKKPVPVLWYKEPTPTIRLEEVRGEVALWIEDREGTLREFRFRASD